MQQIPAEARTLEALAAQGWVMAPERPTLDLGGGGRSEYSFSLRVPETGIRRLLLAVAARDERGCIIAQAERDKPLSDLSLQQFPLSLAAAPMDSSCDGRLPQLLGFSPQVATSEGKVVLTGEDATVTLSGWGFRPGAQVFFGDVASSGVSWRSPTTLLAQVPAQPTQAGPVDLSVVNPDGMRETRTGAFEYIGSLFAEGRGYQTSTYPLTAVSADLNGDDLPELILGLKDGLAVFLNLGKGNFVRKGSSMRPVRASAFPRSSCRLAQTIST